MAEISWTRQSYEADVLLIPLDRDARAWVGEHAADALKGIRFADEDLLCAQRRFEPSPVPVTGEGKAVSSPLEQAMQHSDVVVLFTHDLAAIDPYAVAEIGDAAQLSGKLLGAVVVSAGGRWEGPSSHQAMASIREAADNVIISEDDDLIPDFLQVLRGGTHDRTRRDDRAEVLS